MQRLSLRKSAIYIIVTIFVVSFFQFVRVNHVIRQKNTIDSTLNKGIYLERNEKKEEPKLVILLTNQRSGSTFTAQFFNQDPDIFYMFEPVDALYQALYGTEQGYNVPSDIFFHSNGNKRTMPEHELKFVGDAITDFLTCDFDKVPIQLLTNKFLDLSHFYFGPSVQSLSGYINCLIKDCACDPRHQMCLFTLKGTCPKRFGTAEDKHNGCNKVLHGTNHTNMFKYSSRQINSIMDYKQCTDSYRSNVFRTCISKLREKCENAPVRVVKTVRLTMDIAEYILSKQPQVKIIHLLRDPRSVAVSRAQDPSSMTGLYSGSNITKEAMLYCLQAIVDITKRKTIAAAYPHSTMEILYEKLVQNPLLYFNGMYSFIDYKHISPKAFKWVKDNTKPKSHPMNRISKWQKKINAYDNSQIRTMCSQFYDAFDYQWGDLKT